MRKDELDYLVLETMKKATTAQSLGGYSAEAESLLFIWQALLKILMHLQEEMNAPDYRRALSQHNDQKARADAAHQKRRSPRPGDKVAK